MYIKQTWNNGDVITSAKMNHIEDGIANVQSTADGAASSVNALSANGAIGTKNLANGAVTDAKLASNAVTTAKVADGAVTDAKLAQSGGVLSDVADLKDAIDKRVEFISEEASDDDYSTKIQFTELNKTIDSNGNISNASGYATTDYIDLDGITGIYRSFTTTIRFAMWRYAFYDANKDRISVVDVTTDYTVEEYEGKTVTWLTLNPSAKYIRISWDTSRPYEYWYVKKLPLYTTPQIVIKDANIYDSAVNGNIAKAITNDIAEERSINILNPNDVQVNGYYFDFADGETHVNNDVYKSTANKINTGLIDRLFIYQTFSTTATDGFFILCYSDDAYLGYVVKTFAGLASNHEVSVKEGTTKIRIQYNTAATGNQLCIAITDTGEFVPYEIYYGVKKEALPQINTSVLSGKTVVFLGDSIFGNVQTESGVANVFARLTGATVKNFAFGGTRATLHEGSTPYALGWQKFDGVSIASAIASGDFSEQESALAGGAMSQPSYFAASLANLEAFDFSTCDYIIADWGTNDWTGGASIADYKTALQQIAQTILTAYPNIIFIVTTPFMRFFESSGVFYNSSVYDYRNDDVYLNDFAEAVKECLAIQPYNMQVIDCYNIGINNYTRTGFFSNNDWTHHDARGRERVARFLANEIC